MVNLPFIYSTIAKVKSLWILAKATGLISFLVNVTSTWDGALLQLRFNTSRVSQTSET